jgi:hypothetical protein
MVIEYTKKYFRLRSDKMNPMKRKKIFRAALAKAAQEKKAEPLEVEEEKIPVVVVEEVVVEKPVEVSEESAVPAVPSKKKKGT